MQPKHLSFYAICNNNEVKDTQTLDLYTVRNDPQSQMLHRLFGKQFLDLINGLKEGERRLDDAVEQEGEVHQQYKPGNLQPLERLPAQAERHNPDK